MVDVSNSPVPDGPAAFRFCEASGRRLIAVGQAAGVRHHTVLSIVGADSLLLAEYFQAKMLQEDLIRASGIPYSILHSTQFFEFIAGVVQNGEEDDVAISPALVQPIAAVPCTCCRASAGRANAGGSRLAATGSGLTRIGT